MAETLFRRLGGVERISAIVEESIDRHAVNPVLAPRFAGKDLPRLKELSVQFLCAGMDISDQELIAVTDDIIAALEEQGVPPADVNEIIAILRSLKGEGDSKPAVDTPRR